MSRPIEEVPANVSFPALETEVLARWKAERTFETSVARREGAPEFVFYDGPPFATGLPHYGHILTSYIKDVVPRYQTMRGRWVPRRWGWDCHGLPVEVEAERALGVRSRADILALGVGRFNAACRELVRKYTAEWQDIVERLGRWVDFDHAYWTMDADYMESVLWAFQRLHELGFVYEGAKVVAYCIRCQTPLSNFEARLDDSYRPRTDPAVTVRFALADGSGDALLAWTTTPWTLPSNVALAVGPDVEYVRVATDRGGVWLAAAALARYQKELGDAPVTERRTGRELAGRRYRPLFPWFADTPNGFVVVPADYVTVEDGTGIVHLAPAFGEEDAAVCEALGIVGPNPVGDDGRFDETVPDFAGQVVFDANDAIVRTLKQAGALFRKDTYDHSYPHCWRCDTPLVYRAVRSWFVAVTAFKDRLLAANRQIRWIPAHIRDGRFGNWLENARDWAVSRSRFWGAPIPVWRCGACGTTEVLGSRAEIERRAGRPVDDLHRPAIDEVVYACPRGDGEMRRVPDVFDCWFESGAMPYAQVHYPFENRARFEATFPGDFIVEYVAQTRGWFYTLVVLAAGLFDRPPFRNGVCHGVILAEDGRKMSKRLKNYPDPMELVAAHGSDALRVALLSSAVVSGNDVRFSGDSVRDAVRRFALPLWNGLHLFTAYASIDGFVPTGRFPARTRLDRYLLSETDALRADVEAAMDAYDFVAAYDRIEAWIQTLSAWYIRLTRPRLWREGMDDDKRTAYEVLHTALSAVARVMAPFLPFLAEGVWSRLGHDESVHLQDWPAPEPAWQAPEIATEMRAIRTVVRLARSIREKNAVKHRQPLRRLLVSGLPPHVLDADLDLLREELNVKEVAELASPLEYVERRVTLDVAKLGKRLRGGLKAVQAAVRDGRATLRPDGRLEAGGAVLEPDEFAFRYAAREGNMDAAAEGDVVVILDLATDPALVREGHARELNRTLQDMRKRAGLAYADRVRVSVSGGAVARDVLAHHGAWLAEQVLAEEMTDEPLPTPLVTEAVELGDEPVALGLARS